MSEPASLLPALIPRAEVSAEALTRAADQAAARHSFTDYRERLAPRTLAAHDDDLARFARYLGEVGLTVEPATLAQNGEPWRAVSWGMVAAFVRWQLQQGYAIASINRALSTVKVYSRLALKAGAVSPDEHALIRTVAGYSPRQGRRVDAGRTRSRLGRKKPVPTRLSREQARQLKQQPATPQGRRDALMLCLLLDHGLRVGELAGLQRGAIDLVAGTLTFYREKVDKQQTHKLSADTFRAATAYLGDDGREAGPLLQGSRRGGRLVGAMSARAIRERVRLLGEAAGVSGLAPHDLRHLWASSAARAGTHPFVLQEAGGWGSLEMPRRYVEAAKVANESLLLEL